MKFSNYWKFESDQAKKDVEATIQSSRLFLEHYKTYLERRSEELEKQILERGLVETYTWKDKLASIIGEKRAVDREIKLISEFLENIY